jgi:hypothetical protein
MARYTITIEIDENGVNVVPRTTTAALAQPRTQTSSGDLAGRVLSSSFERSVTAFRGSGGPGDTGPATGGPGDTGPGSGGPGDTGPGSGGPGDTGTATGGPGDTGPATGGMIYTRGGTGTGIPLQHQEQVEWCWAAIAVAIDKYFNPSSSLRQCDVANRVVRRDDCCGAGAGTTDCNVAEKLQDALASIGRSRGAIPQAYSFEEVQTEIDAGRPVCARIEWASGGAHFVALDGYRVLPSGAQHIHVADPLNPPSEVDFDEFKSAYHGEGTWTGTYLVRGS